VLTQQLIATHLDLSQVEVGKLMADLGIDWKASDLATIRIAYIRKIRAVAAGHKSHDGIDLVAARARNELLDSELKELNLAEKRGQLVNLAQLEPELVQMIAAFKIELLALPDKLKAELDALYSIDVDASFIEAQVLAAMVQMSKYDVESSL
jgi:phage terminase Nu1 subunit (DNA packaging protein)